MYSNTLFGAGVLTFVTVLASQARADGTSVGAANATTVGQVVVTASRIDLVGKAITASQGTVTKQEVQLRPIYRVGQLYETVPGLVVTVHSGESKANQYELRGFDLDHGTDFASFIDGLPVNQGTNLHGQGYSDQSFLMPEVVSGLDYTKGPYFAANGDFSAVGSAHVHLVDVLPDQVSASAGTLSDDDVFVGGTHVIDDTDRVWVAAEFAHVDGPWDPASGYNKGNAAFRFSHGTDADGFSLTGMFNQSAGRLETDQPLRAIQAGLIGRFGVLDPTDRGRTRRYSLSGHYGVEGQGWRFTANAYAIHSDETLINNFTHFLDDAVNGDQELQDEARDVLGGDAALTLHADLGAIQTDTVFGVQERRDNVLVGRQHTKQDVTLDYCEVEGPFPPGITPPPPPPDAPPSDGNATPVPAAGATSATRTKAT